MGRKYLVHASLMPWSKPASAGLLICCLPGDPLQVLHTGATHSVSLAQVTYVGVQKVDVQNEGKWRSQDDYWAQAESLASPDFYKV